jgi:hypothetical protein
MPIATALSRGRGAALINSLLSCMAFVPLGAVFNEEKSAWVEYRLRIRCPIHYFVPLEDMS